MGKEAADKEKGKKAKVKRPTPLKRDEQATKRNIRNRAMKSRIHTAIRNFEESLEKGDKEDIQNKLNDAYSALDKAAQKGIVKKNTTSRTKARLTARVA